MPKKKKKNPSDINLLARAVVEAAIGEPITKKQITLHKRKTLKRSKTNRL